MSRLYTGTRSVSAENGLACKPPVFRLTARCPAFSEEIPPNGLSGCCGNREDSGYDADYGDGLAQDFHLFPGSLRGYCSTEAADMQEKKRGFFEKSPKNPLLFVSSAPVGNEVVHFCRIETR